MLVLQLLLRLREVGLIDDAAVLERLSRAETALAWFIAPVGGFPPIGDSDRVRSLEHRTRRQLVLPPPFTDETLRFAYTEGLEGTPPGTNFRVFEAAGYVVARDRWGTAESFRTASYFLQQCGFHSHVHKHADDLSFVWYAHGTDLLTDAGRFGLLGRTEKKSELQQQGFYYDDPRRVYVESTRAHNTLEVDSRPYARLVVPWGTVVPYGSALRHADCDAGTGVVATEAEVIQFESVRHRRLVFHQPGAWTAVIDTASAEDGETHDLVQRFHFGPDLELVEAGDRVRLGIPGASDELVAVQVTDAEPLEPVRGQQEPELLGFNARHLGKLLPNWTAAWRRTGVVTGEFAALFALAPADTAVRGRGRVAPGAEEGRITWEVGETGYELRWRRTPGGLRPRLRTGRIAPVFGDSLSSTQPGPRRAHKRLRSTDLPWDLASHPVPLPASARSHRPAARMLRRRRRRTAVAVRRGAERRRRRPASRARRLRSLRWRVRLSRKLVPRREPASHRGRRRRAARRPCRAGTLGLDRSHITAVGTGAGGFAALHLAAREGWGDAIVGFPHVRLGRHLVGDLDEVASFIAGGISP